MSGYLSDVGDQVLTPEIGALSNADNALPMLESNIRRIREDLLKMYQGNFRWVETTNGAELQYYDSTTDTWTTIFTVTPGGGFIKKTTRITANYTLTANDCVLFCDTDGGAIQVDLPAGVNGTEYRIINTGSSGNDVTLVPNGSELLFGLNASEYLADAEKVIIVYETTEGWA